MLLKKWSDILTIVNGKNQKDVVSIEQTIDASLQQAEALRKSILKQAFEGNL